MLKVLFIDQNFKTCEQALSWSGARGLGRGLSADQIESLTGRSVNGVGYNLRILKLSVRRSSYVCTGEVWRAREKRKLLECSLNFPSASITRNTHRSMNQFFFII